MADTPATEWRAAADEIIRWLDAVVASAKGTPLGGVAFAAMTLIDDETKAIERQASEITALRAEVEALRAAATAYRHLREAAHGAMLLIGPYGHLHVQIEARRDYAMIIIRDRSGEQHGRGVPWTEIEQSALNPLLMHMDDMLAQMGVDMPDDWSWVDPLPAPPAEG